MSCELSIVVPVFNEEKSIPELYSRLHHAATSVTAHYEIIFINDGSRDNTMLELVKITAGNPRVYYIDFSRNFGHQIAVTAGLDKCRGNAVVIIDGDLQDPPELIPELYHKLKEGYDVVAAKRGERIGESRFKKVTAKLFYRLLRKLTNIDIPLDTGDFRIVTGKVVKYLTKMPEQNKFIRGQIAWMGFKSTQVIFTRDKRKYGKTGYTFSKMLRLAIDGISAFSDKPLLFVSRLGLLISVISFLVMIYALIAHFFFNSTITGWTSVIVAVTFIGGIQLIAIGIIGEYLVRINKNIINRPLYIIRDTNMEE